MSDSFAKLLATLQHVGAAYTDAHRGFNDAREGRPRPTREARGYYDGFDLGSRTKHPVRA